MTRDSVTDGLVKLSVLDIFTSDNYRIPLYQRAYAWTKSEIHTLLVDIQDARKLSELRDEGSELRKYYIGSLVVDTSRSEGEETHEVVDGQQRLTTLFIILSVAPETLGVPLPPDVAFLYREWSALLENKLTYEGRHDAREDLRRLAQRGSGAISSLQTDGIKNAAEIVLTAVSAGADDDCAGTTSASANSNSAADSPVFTAADLEYLLDHVMILRTNLPPGTDLNHYFEVMNTRGEQLEKHEILKARLMSAVADDPVEQAIFSQVWDACSILDRHIQVQFSSKHGNASERTKLFGGTWDRFIPRSGEDLFETLREARGHRHSDNSSGGAPSHIALAAVLRNAQPTQSESTERKNDDDGSYGAIIDFPNLLLHVLKIFRDESFAWNVEVDSTSRHVRLEDKYLLEEFTSSHADNEGQLNSFDAGAVREFAFVLLQTRFLLDSYVIRTQANLAGDQEENWVLHRAYGATQRGKKELRARATFSESALTDDPDGTEAAIQRQVLLLQSMFQVTDTRRQSKYFLFQILQWLSRQDHHAPVRGQELVNLLESSARDRLTALYSRENVDLGTKVQNFLFNVLDYELWKLASDEARLNRIVDPETDVGRISTKALADAAGKFRFRYRTSVEHFYPQEPATAEGHERLPKEIVDQFGNLCIMSRSENSKRSNFMPKTKADEFSSTEQSLNFQLMVAVAEQMEWNRTEITAHGATLMRLLEDVIASHGQANSGQLD